MKLYVNWYEQEVLTEREINERLEAYIKEECDTYDFCGYLDKHYAASELFEMSDAEKMIVETEYTEWVKKDIAENFFMEWEEIEIEPDPPTNKAFVVSVKNILVGA